MTCARKSVFDAVFGCFLVGSAVYPPEATSNDIEQSVMAADAVVVSDLTLAEAKNAIIRKGRRGELMSGDVALAIHTIDAHVAERRFYLIEMQRAFLQQVPELSQQAPVHMRTLDGQRLAAALSIQATAMATYDLDLAKAVRTRSMAVIGVQLP